MRKTTININAITATLLLTTTGAVSGADAPSEEIARVLIRNVAVWDGTADSAVAGQDVLVQGKLIAAIGNGLDAPAGADVVDGGGRVLIPGIIDAHTHIALPLRPADAAREDPAYVAALSFRVAEKLLMRGWTTARDVGGPVQGIARAIDDGLAIGPRIYPSAMTISQTSGHADIRALTDPHPNMDGAHNAYANRYALLADGPAEVRRAVREALRQGAVQIKLMAGGGVSTEYDPLDTVQYSPEELRAAVESAADWHTYVTVHAYTDEAVNRALDAGVLVIEHGHLLSEPTLKRIKSDGAYLSSQSFGFVRQILADTPIDPKGKAQSVLDGVDGVMATARKIGLPVAFGTDAFGSLRAYESAVGEFGYRTRWFDSLEILKQATSHNAKLLELTGPRNPYPDGPLGVIVEGAYADLLVVDGDPLSDVTVLQDYANNIRLIMKDGRVYKNTL